MAGELTAKDLQDIARLAKIDSPIQAYRVVGNRVELTLLGGVKREIPLQIKVSLEDMSLKELRSIAFDMNIPDRSGRTKSQLIKLIKEAGYGKP